MELIDFIKGALKHVQDVQLHTDAWELHVKSYEELKKENYNIDAAWHELSCEYSELMADIRKIKEFIETWQTFSN